MGFSEKQPSIFHLVGLREVEAHGVPLHLAQGQLVLWLHLDASTGLDSDEAMAKQEPHLLSQTKVDLERWREPPASPGLFGVLSLRSASLCLRVSLFQYTLYPVAVRSFWLECSHGFLRTRSGELLTSLKPWCEPKLKLPL